MKTLLIIAITGMSFACYGQAGTWGKSASAEPYGFLPDTPSVKQLSLEEKLLIYADWCEKNPIKIYYARLLDGSQMAGSNLTSEKEMDKIRQYNTHLWVKVSKWEYEHLNRSGMEFKIETIHRKPTFEGFIEWLKKK